MFHCFTCYVFIHARLMCDFNKSMSMRVDMWVLYPSLLNTTSRISVSRLYWLTDCFSFSVSLCVPLSIFCMFVCIVFFVLFSTVFVDMANKCVHYYSVVVGSVLLVSVDWFGWEDHLQKYLYCVEWKVKLYCLSKISFLFVSCTLHCILIARRSSTSTQV